MRERVVKIAVLSLLILLSAVILTWGIRQYRLFYEWLEPRHIEGIVLMTLIGFGLTILFIPFVVKQDWANSSATDVALHYLLSFGLMFTALIVVFILLWLLGLIYAIVRSYPLVLITLLIILPLIGKLAQKYSGKGEGNS